MDPRDLIRIALHLAAGAVGGGRGRPRQAELRRAISAAYYAMFHALANSCANQLAGMVPAGRAPAAWRQAYRALEHGHARNQCANSSGMSQFPAEVQDFGRHFVDMQFQRQSADYDPSARFFRLDVTELIAETNRKIEDFNNVSRAAQRAFAIYVLHRSR